MDDPQVQAALWYAYGKMLHDKGVRLIDALHVYRSRWDEFGGAAKQTADAWDEVGVAERCLRTLLKARPEDI